jgi:4-hydroxy-tetrahydrodipicolinate synthase
MDSQIHGPFVHGAIAMLITPFTPDWSVDLDAVAQVAQLALDQGASGLAVHGLASEGYKLLDAERGRIIEAVAKAGTVPLLLAGVDHEATAGSVALARSAADAGASAVMAMPPKSSGGSRARLVDYFCELEARGGLPVVIQDAPRASGITMDAEMLVAIIAAFSGPNAVKVEDAIPPLKIATLTRKLAATTQTALYGGAGGRRFLDELDAGAIGTMVGPAYIDLFAHLQAKHATYPDASRDMMRDCLDLIHAVEGNEWYALLQKALLKRAGLIANSGLRPPAIQPDPQYMTSLVAIYDRAAARQSHLGAVLNAHVAKAEQG